MIPSEGYLSEKGQTGNDRRISYGRNSDHVREACAYHLAKANYAYGKGSLMMNVEGYLNEERSVSRGEEA